MSCIYKIINKINNKIYIGETNRTIAIRWKQHLRNADDLAKTEYLYRAMRKYGKENFGIELITNCEPEIRFELETKYILEYNSLAPNGYNLILSQNGITPLMTQEIINLWNEGMSIIRISTELHMNPKTISIYLKNNGVTAEEIYERRAKNIGKYSSKIVIRYSLDGEYMDEWKSASEAARILQYNVASICKCCKGDLITYKNYIWQYKEGDDIENVVLLVKTKSKVGKNEKAILCFDLNNNFIKEYSSVSAAGRDFGVTHAGIAYAARNEGIAYGHYWKYKGE